MRNSRQSTLALLLTLSLLLAPSTLAAPGSPVNLYGWISDAWNSMVEFVTDSEAAVDEIGSASIPNGQEHGQLTIPSELDEEGEDGDEAGGPMVIPNG